MAGLRSRLVVSLTAGLGAVLAIALAGCAAETPSLAPANLAVECEGEGGPTVILMPGLSADASVFSSLQTTLAEDGRVCSYSRAGIGASPSWPDDLPDPSAGRAADQLLATLDDMGEQGPYVVLGWSYGGLVAQALAARHPESLAGLVLEDAATVELFDAPSWDTFHWAEGGRDIDTAATADEVEDLDLDDLPLIVLTQGDLQLWDDPVLWMQTQDRLATLSDDAVHVVATDAGHAVHWDAEPLVARAVADVVEAVRSGAPLAACDPDEWGPLTGECRAP